MSHCPSVCGNGTGGCEGCLTVGGSWVGGAQMGGGSPVCPVPAAGPELRVIPALTNDGLCADPKTCLSPALAEHMLGVWGGLGGGFMPRYEMSSMMWAWRGLSVIRSHLLSPSPGLSEHLCAGSSAALCLPVGRARLAAPQP